MSIQFSSVSQQTQLNGVKCMTYAPAGHGKTVLCATAPNPLMISAESGLMSIRRQNLEKMFGVGNPTISYDMPVIVISTVEDLNEAWRWCAQSSEAKQFQTINLDSISEIAEVLLSAAKKACKDPRQAYGEVLDKMMVAIRSFRDIPGFNVHFCSKMESQKDEMSGIIKWGPSMPGNKLGNQLPYFFDEVFYLGVGKDDKGNQFRYLQTFPDVQYVAKDRSGALDRYEYPDLTRVFNKIKGVTN